MSSVLLAGAASLALASAAGAADLRTFAFAYATNGDHPFDVLAGSNSDLRSAGTAIADLNSGYTFEGVDWEGNYGFMGWSAVSTAVAETGLLRAGVNSSLLGAFAGDNAPYRECVEEVCVTNMEGVPDRLKLQAQASFSDDFTVEGGAGLSFIEFGFRIDGSIQAIGPSVSTGLILFGDSIDPYFAPSGVSDATIFTRRLQVVDSMVNLSLVMDASVEHDLSVFSGMSSQDFEFGEVDFLQTLTLTSVRGLDASGRTVALTSVTGGGGESFNDLIAATVPEPEAWALLIVGFGTAGAVLRRRRILRVSPQTTAAA